MLHGKVESVAKISEVEVLLTHPVLFLYVQVTVLLSLEQMLPNKSPKGLRSYTIQVIGHSTLSEQDHKLYETEFIADERISDFQTGG